MNGWRKYSLAFLSLAIAGVGLFVGVVGEVTFASIVGTVLTLYGASNVVDKKFGGQG